MAKIKAATGSRSAEFKSQIQFSVTAFVLCQRFNALVLMLAGAGKTTCMLLPVVVEKAEMKSTIIIVPLRALVTQHLMKTSKFGLVASADFGDPRTDTFAHLYVFSAEQVHKAAFRELISRLLTNQLLSRVVIDEAHLTLLWETFQVSLQSIRTGLSVIPSHIPRILFSATVPLHHRATVLEMHGINDATVFSMLTPRKNLGFEVFVFQAQSQSVDQVGRYVTAWKSLIYQSLDLLVKRLLEKVEKDREHSSKCEIYRVMVYVLAKCEVGIVREELQNRCDAAFSSKAVVTQTLMYHGAVADDEREQMQQKWFASPSGGERVWIRVMVCTSAFETGVDVPSVRLILHIGGARSLLEFVQECGRAGRDGFRATCLTTYDIRYEASVTHDQDGAKSETEKLFRVQCRNEMTTWLLSDKTCRKNRLYSYSDGGVSGVCRFDAKTVWCDECRVGAEGVDTDSIVEGTSESASLWHETDCAGQANLATPTSREQDPGIDDSHSRASSRKRSSNASLEAAAANRRRIDYDAIKALAHTNSGSASAWTENAGTFKVYRPQVHRQLPVAGDNLEPYPWIETASGDDIIELLCEVHGMAQETCLMCLAVKGVREKHLNMCGWLGERCLRCYSTGHRVVGCRKNTKNLGTCSGCGMTTCKKYSLHVSGFAIGFKCKLQFIIKICWKIWDRPPIRDSIAQNFFTTDSAKKYRTLRNNRRAQAMHAIFSEALTESPDSVPMPVRVALSWAFEKGIIGKKNAQIGCQFGLLLSFKLYIP